MENETPGKKPKRPRIGQTFHVPEEGQENKTQLSFDRPYQPRPYSNTGYNNGHRPQRPYDNHQHGGYNNRPYHINNTESAEGSENAEEGQAPTFNRQQRPYQQRPYNNGGQGSYNRQPRPYSNNNGGQGGYNRPQRLYNNNNNGQGGYNRPQRPYNNNNNGQGGYNRPQRPYNNNNGGQGGYNRPQRPYNNNNGGQGGYNRPQRPYNNNGGNAPFAGRGKSFVPRPKRIEYEVPVPDPNEEIRLNKYMSNAGICSRREADEFIQQGLVKVNGQVVTELGTKITHSDVVEYDEKVVTPQSKCYILLNKPKDCVTTSDDPNGRLTVMDLVKGACTERIYPVGRLDRNTTGVLLLTNDGDLASKLTHPKFIKKKIYHVWCDRDIAEDDMQRIADGIELEDGPIHADAISYATETDRNQAGIEIHSGRNRIVRRIFESLGYHVTKLDRVYFAGLTKKNLPRGRWRYLTQQEVNYLKMGAFE